MVSRSFLLLPSTSVHNSVMYLRVYSPGTLKVLPPIHSYPSAVSDVSLTYCLLRGGIGTRNVFCHPNCYTRLPLCSQLMAWEWKPTSRGSNGCISRIIQGAVKPLLSRPLFLHCATWSCGTLDRIILTVRVTYHERLSHFRSPRQPPNRCYYCEPPALGDLRVFELCYR